MNKEKAIKLISDAFEAVKNKISYAENALTYLKNEKSGNVPGGPELKRRVR